MRYVSLEQWEKGDWKIQAEINGVMRIYPLQRMARIFSWHKRFGEFMHMPHLAMPEIIQIVVSAVPNAELPDDPVACNNYGTAGWSKVFVVFAKISEVSRWVFAGTLLAKRQLSFNVTNIGLMISRAVSTGFSKGLT